VPCLSAHQSRASEWAKTFHGSQIEVEPLNKSPLGITGATFDIDGDQQLVKRWAHDKRDSRFAGRHR
jgi:hypothetical protein